MKILVLNGSPKGKNSITVQTVNYLKMMHPEHDFVVLDAGQKIKALEKDFTPACKAIEEADALIFSYPVYTFIAPSQLHRFIELMKEHRVRTEGKFATQITTSKHFYDVTAHKYIQENCQDMGMRFVRGLSADMDDLLKEKGRTEAENFWRHFCWCMETGICEADMRIAAKSNRIPASACAPVEKREGDVVIIADTDPEETQLNAMIERFRAKLPVKSRVVNLREYPFRGGCLGCFHCAADGKCIYTDGFDAFLRGSIQNAQAMIYAFKIRDHSMGSRFKMYDDRQFCNGHRTVSMGMPVGYLISGAYSAEPNLQTIVEARCQVGSNVFCGVAGDEKDTDAQIDHLAASVDYALREDYLQPQNFYGVGGMKIFRDLIWQMRGMMKADHKFYKAHGQYDFPQKNRGTILKMYLVGMLISSPKIRAKMGDKMTEGMLLPYKKLFQTLSEQKK